MIDTEAKCESTKGLVNCSPRAHAEVPCLFTYSPALVEDGLSDATALQKGVRMGFVFDSASGDSQMSPCSPEFEIFLDTGSALAPSAGGGDTHTDLGPRETALASTQRSQPRMAAEENSKPRPFATLPSSGGDTPRSPTTDDGGTRDHENPATSTSTDTTAAITTAGSDPARLGAALKLGWFTSLLARGTALTCTHAHRRAKHIAAPAPYEKACIQFSCTVPQGIGAHPC